MDKKNANIITNGAQFKAVFLDLDDPYRLVPGAFCVL